MDNLFQLLIFLFVIYTIVNSVFGKKKTQQRNPMPQENTGGIETDSPAPSKSRPADVIQEMFGFKIPKTGSEYDKYQSKDYPVNYDVQYQSVEDLPLAPTDIPDIDYDNLPALEFQNNAAAPVEAPSAYDIKKKGNKRTQELREKLKSPESLRDLIIISEILNKPKALRG